MGRDAQSSQQKPAAEKPSDAGLLRGDASVIKTTPSTLCDGSNKVRVAMLSTPPGAPLPGTRMFGWFPLFYLTGDCTLYLANGSWEDLRSRKLAPDELSALEMDVALDRWATLEARYCNNQIDGPGSINYLTGQTVNIYACTGPNPPQWFAAIAFSDVIAKWYTKATRVPSPLWYTLVRSDFPDTLGPAFASAPTWMRGNPSELGTDDVSKMPPPLRFADGMFADELREMRQLWLDGKIGYKHADFIPVLSSERTRYELRVRAVTTIDDDAGTPQLPK